MPGVSETRDEFGSALLISRLRGAAGSGLTIGIPYEDTGSIADAGAATVLFGGTGGVTANGSKTWSQESAGVPGPAEKNDWFGLPSSDQRGRVTSPSADRHGQLPVTHRPENGAVSQSIADDALPLILVVSGEEGVRQGLVHDIARRFGADYTVSAAATAEAALDRLESQTAAGATTALVIADERLRTRRPPTSSSASVRRNPRPNASC